MASLSLPQRAQRGETTAGQLRLYSNARLPMRLAATLTLRNRLTGERRTIPLQARLRARGQLQLPLEVSSAHCGAVEVTVSQLLLLDAFGLFSRRLSCRAEALLRVLPDSWPLTVSLAENAEAAADGARYSAKTPGPDPGETFRIDRVCWLEGTVTIPAGGSLTVTAEMTKSPSFDYACARTENRGIYGYDMVTALGSQLTFTGQEAVIEDRGLVEIAFQNFGFDLETGVRRVALDVGQDHYYLGVQRRT